MTIVLVHGAWSGAWSWQAAARLLRRRGFEVYAPTLTGMAERSHVSAAAVGLESHIADIAGLLRYEELENVLLVGHSYGGMVITGAADRVPERIGGLVYLDAFLPRSGEALWDIVEPEMAERQRQLAREHDGGVSVPRPPGMSPPDASDRVARLRTPQPARTLAEKFVSVRKEQTWPRRHYILCTENAGTFVTVARRVRDDPAWEYSEFAAAHDVVRTKPQLTADRLSEIAERWGIIDR